MFAYILLNITICFAITISSFALAWVLSHSGQEHSKKSKPALWAFVMFWALVGAIYLPTTLGMISAYQGILWLDQLLYYLAAIPFAFLSVPLVYFIIYVILGNGMVSRYISLAFVLFGALYLFLLYSSGVVGPVVTEWGSLFSINNNIAINVYLVGLFVFPTAMVLGLLLLMLLQRVPKRLRYRTTLPLVAISFVFDFILTDFISVIDLMQVAARLFVLIGIVLAFLAYFPPMTLQEKLRIVDLQHEVCENGDDLELDLGYEGKFNA